MSTPEAQALPFDYIGQAQCTKSDQFHGEKVTYMEFMSTLGAAIAILQKLDAIKKALFYGRNFQLQDELDGAVCCTTIANGWTVKAGEDIWRLVPSHKAMDIIHSILGAATESGESLELLNATLRDELHRFDEVNFKEEIFDTQWYHAIGCDAINLTFDEGQRNNIAKLRKRFGPKFSEYDANNRNLDAEREVLEVTTSRLTGEPVPKVRPPRTFIDGHNTSHDPL